MTLKLVDQPSGPGPLSVLLLGVVMAIAGSSKAGAQNGQKGPLTFGPDGCTLNHQENCNLEQLKEQMAFPKAGDLVRWHTAEAIGRLGGPTEAKDMAEAVIRESGRGPNVMNPFNAVDPLPIELKSLTRLAALPGAPDVSGIIMDAYQKLYDKNKATYKAADDYHKHYYDVKGFGNEAQMGKLMAAYLVLPPTCEWKTHLNEFMSRNSGDGGTAPSNKVSEIINSPAYQATKPCPP